MELKQLEELYDEANEIYETKEQELKDIKEELNDLRKQSKDDSNSVDVRVDWTCIIV